MITSVPWISADYVHFRSKMNEKFFILILILAIFSCTSKKMVKETPAHVKSPIKKATYLWAYKPVLNVRARTSPGSVKIGQLHDGDSVAVLKNENGWYEIQWTSGNRGYIRSDLLAPKEFTIFPRAVHFIDSLKEKHNIDIFFDKEDHHRKIYISYPDAFFVAENIIAQTTNQLVKSYQESVYAGKVTAVILKPNSKDIYNTAEFTGLTNADLLLPVIPFGFLDAVIWDIPDKVMLVILIPENVTDSQFLPAARQMASVYPLHYNHVEFRFVAGNGNCRFWFQEDASGEQYQYNNNYAK
jgi:hypothetical protein